jgi:hypothetical protein
VHPFRYYLIDGAKKSKSNGSSGKDKDSKVKDEKLDDALRDLKISWISK